MNEKILRTVKAKIEQDGISQGALAKRMEIERSNLARLVNGRGSGMPKRWQQLLDELGLELIAVPKQDDQSPGSTAGQ